MRKNNGTPRRSYPVALPGDVDRGSVHGKGPDAVRARPFDPSPGDGPYEAIAVPQAMRSPESPDGSVR